ncbi:LLM class flavin-dependent oxidoreductase [uncultured Jatrophihabitans sp.]|uniref:LLM class flavin-dependent oxidoreductase n=1 Tax=uncultured Jatrophihabitans sp. TaxID=1610747 RepID=UPI0035C9C630
MELGVILGTWNGNRADADAILATVQEAERLGYAIAWVPELYGADAVSVMSWLAANTSTIRIGSAVMQIPARAATTTAMSVASLVALYGDRIVLGLGVSGPQVSEGWYGSTWDDPVGRTREYVETVKLALSRERVTYAGKHINLPGRADYRPLKLVLRNETHIPVYLAAIGPRNVALAAEICDGWLPALVFPERFGPLRDRFTDALEAAGRRREDVVIAASTGAVINDDLAIARDVYRPYVTLLIGGMGTREQNFYRNLVTAYGYGEVAEEITELYLAGQVAEAQARTPDDLIDGVGLVGDEARVAERLEAYRAAGIDIFSVAPSGRTVEQKLQALRTVAAAAGL